MGILCRKVSKQENEGVLTSSSQDELFVISIKLAMNVNKSMWTAT